MIKSCCLLFIFIGVTINITRTKAQSSTVNIKAYIIDSDTSGTNVRNAPNGTIKKVLHFKDMCKLATIVRIRDCSDNGWLLVSTLDNCVEKVTGWVHSSLIYVSITPWQMDPKSDFQTILPVFLYESYSIGSKKLYSVSSNQEVNVVGCKGAWVYVKMKINKKVVYGWLRPEDQCANPFTSCGP